MELSAEPVQRVLGALLAALFLFLLLLTVLLVALSFPVGIYTVFFTHLSNSTSGTLGYPYLLLGPIPLVLPFPVTYGAAFVTAIAIYVGMFLLAAFQGKSLSSAISSGLRLDSREFLSNRALLTIVAIGFLVFTAGLIDELVSALGPPIGNPFTGGDALLTFLGFTLAPLREEFGFRVLIIGLVATIMTISRPGSSPLKALWRPSVAYEGVNNNTVVLAVIWATGVISAGAFGACHVACGGNGWDIGKLPEATYGGLVLAYLYIRYGFHVAVLAHWGIDYFPSVFAFFGQGAYGIPWDSIPGFVLQQVVATDLFLCFGVASLLAATYVGATRLSRRSAEIPPSVPPEVHKPPDEGNDGDSDDSPWRFNTERTGRKVPSNLSIG